MCLKVGVFLRNLWACGSHPLCHRPWCISRSSRSNWELVRDGTGERLPELLPGGWGPSAPLGGWSLGTEVLASLQARQDCTGSQHGAGFQKNL